MYDYIIIGQGIAGTVLSIKLREKGFKILVIDSPTPNTSSEVAAGIMNPITGKRMTLSWEASAFFPEATAFYKRIQELHGNQYFYNYPVYRIFSSITEQNDWSAKVTDERFNLFVDKESLVTLSNPLIKNPFGAMRVMGGGRVDVVRLIDAERERLQSLGAFSREHVTINKIVDNGEAYQIGVHETRKVVFCTGYDPVSWGFLPFTPMKGEVLEVQSQHMDVDKTLVGGCFFSPINDNRFYAGATYDWRNVDLLRTPAAKEEILNKLSGFINDSVTVEQHKVGIRPAVKDRRPLLGEHPDKRKIYLFGGLGSKGVSMAPLLADQMIAFMESGKLLNKETDLNRFL